MADQSNGYLNIWGGAQNKEFRLKEFVHHQDKEATLTREAIEGLSQQVAIQTAMQAEALRQIGSILYALHHESNLGRITPDILFQAIQIKQSVIDPIKQFLSTLQELPTSEVISPEFAPKCVQYVELIRGIANMVYSIDRTYLVDFSQKKALQDLREEMKPIIEQWNNVKHLNASLRYLLTQQIVSKRYAYASKFSKADINAYISLRQEWVNASNREKTTIEDSRNLKTGINTVAGISSLVSIIVGIVLMNGDNGGAGIFFVTLPPLICCGLIVYFNTKYVSEPQSQIRSLKHSLALRVLAIHPPDEIEPLAMIKDELMCKGNTWVLNKKGKKAIDQEINMFWLVDMPT